MKSLMRRRWRNIWIIWIEKSKEGEIGVGRMDVLMVYRESDEGKFEEDEEDLIDDV